MKLAPNSRNPFSHFLNEKCKERGAISVGTNKEGGGGGTEVDAYFGFESMMGQKGGWRTNPVLVNVKMSSITRVTNIFQTLERFKE